MKRDLGRDRVRMLLETLGARAAGLWRLEGAPRPARLVLLEFASANDLPIEVSDEFAQATRVVLLDQPNLGIVRAVVDGVPAVSVAAEMSADEGSGLWLRRFGAARSVAVPLLDRSGAVAGVMSVALASVDQPPDEDVARVILEHD